MRGKKTAYFADQIGERLQGIRKHQWVLLFMTVGAALGVLLLFQVDPSVLPGKETVHSWIRQTQLQKQELYGFYLIRKRAVLPVFWFLCSSTGIGIGILCLGWIYIGFSVGVFMGVLFRCVGIRALLLCWGITMPQYLFYLPALFLIYLGCQMRWSGRRTGEYTRFFAQRQWSPQKKLYLLRMVLGIVLYGVGLWCECVVNPIIMARFFTKM